MFALALKLVCEHTCVITCTYIFSGYQLYTRVHVSLLLRPRDKEATHRQTETYHELKLKILDLAFSSFC